MQGVTIVNTVDTLCEYSGLTIGTEYETKCKSGTEGVVYAFSQNADKSAWVYSGYAIIDADALIDGMTQEEVNKAIIQSETIRIQGMIRGKSGTGGVRKALSNMTALIDRFAAGEIDKDEFMVLRSELK
jgi:hypothetical protein